MDDNRTFDAVTLRAVDDMPAAIAAAAFRAAHKLLILSTLNPQIPPDFTIETTIPMPESHDSVLIIAHRC
jgi:16S rRNA (guanine527-N7)-methyltransferase